MPPTRLLIVEDDLASLELLAELLGETGAQTYPLADATEASRAINREKYDGIFLDIKMPVLNGFELARLIRESPINKSTPIVIVTGRDEKDTMHLSFSVGATYFLQKPVDKTKLSALLKKIHDPVFENRRRCTRVPFNTQVACTVADKALNGLTWNISQGGIQLEVDGLKMGDAIKMSFIVPDPATVIRALGVVVWSQEERQGLYFTEMSVEDQETVRAYITRTELLPK